ncbi:hypothetical protein AB0K43_16050 [Kitasatospora sp. NPDC049258]|uniref:hypothetical protein n=1 Tax=Kitasatospora sp. NPDC049258 TaxID=3155394 RepID=UPI00342D9DAC
MNQKYAQKCLAVVAPAFAPGEQVTLVESVAIGKVPAGRQVAAAALAGVVSGGTVLVAVKPRAYYLVLTDRRMYLVDNVNGRVGRSIVSATPREKITAGPLRKHLLTLSMEVRFEGAAAPSRFSWGRVVAGSARAVAEALAG